MIDEMDYPSRYERWFDSTFCRRADRVERQILSRLLSGIPDAGSLLDVGCGTGHFADFWSSAGLHCVGLDRDPRLLQFARTHRPWFPVVLGDAEHLPFRDGAVSVIAYVTVLEFLAAPERALREASRVAKKGLLLGVLAKDSPVAWWRRLTRARAYRGARFFTPRSLDTLVRWAIPDRELKVRTETGLGLLPSFNGKLRQPFGTFIGASVIFA
jgi:ubiquinone/menaquinone biosynthesis C-methylase UbiE